jgi:hypothetical protein
LKNVQVSRLKEAQEQPGLAWGVAAGAVWLIFEPSMWLGICIRFCISAEMSGLK